MIHGKPSLLVNPSKKTPSKARQVQLARLGRHVKKYDDSLGHINKSNALYHKNEMEPWERDKKLYTRSVLFPTRVEDDQFEMIGGDPFEDYVSGSKHTRVSRVRAYKRRGANGKLETVSSHIRRVNPTRKRKSTKKRRNPKMSMKGLARPLAIGGGGFLLAEAMESLIQDLGMKQASELLTSKWFATAVKGAAALGVAKYGGKYASPSDRNSFLSGWGASIVTDIWAMVQNEDQALIADQEALVLDDSLDPSMQALVMDGYQLTY